MMYWPTLIPVEVSMLLLGIASGAAMVPYSVIKEANPDEVKGSAAGAINFLVFSIGPLHAGLYGRTLATTTHHAEHFRSAGLFWIVCCVAAALVSLLLRETGHASPGRTELSYGT